jgi:hypothetical protein
MLKTVSPSSRRTESTIRPIFLPSAANEFSHAMGLPAGCLHNLGKRCPALPLEQTQNLGLLAAVCGGFVAPLARFRLAALAFAVFAFLGCFAAAFALLARFGAVVAASVAPPPSRLWIAFQMRAIADFRSVNFLTGMRPGMPFQTSIIVSRADDNRALNAIVRFCPLTKV